VGVFVEVCQVRTDIYDIEGEASMDKQVNKGGRETTLWMESVVLYGMCVGRVIMESPLTDG
jgi:hypothetical protein